MTAPAERVPIDPLLFAWPSAEPRLLGSRCTACGVVTFPQQTGCPRCCSTAVETRPLGTHGTLWTWTTQEFPPKSPPYRPARPDAPFEPYAVGYVELPGEVRVEARLVVERFADLAIGMPMRLVFVPAFRDAQGREVVTYAFAPVRSGSPRARAPQASTEVSS